MDGDRVTINDNQYTRKYGIQNCSGIVSEYFEHEVASDRLLVIHLDDGRDVLLDACNVTYMERMEA